MSIESPTFQQAIRKLLLEAGDLHKQGHHNEARKRLAEAHILSQPFAGLHTWVHVHMLKAALRERSLAEALGQLLRIAVAAPGSWLKRYPVGNTGLSDVSMFKPMPIPEELQRQIRELESATGQRGKRESAGE